MAKKTTRKCGLCRRPGHDRRTCSATQQKQTRKKKPAVFVRVAQPTRPSAHVVDLKNRDREKTVEAIAPYRESSRVEEQRVPVDLAAMVRAAKEKERVEKARAPITYTATTKRVARPRLLKKISLPTVSLPRLPRPSISVVPVANRLRAAGQTVRDRFVARRSLAAGLALLLLFVLPFPATGYYLQVRDDSRRIVEESTNAFLSLQSSTVAALNANTAQASHDLNAALASFDTAQTLIDRDHKALAYVAGLLPVIGPQVTSRQQLLAAGHHLALGNTYLVRGMEQTKGSEEPLTDRLEILRAHLRSALPQYEQALHDLSAVDTRIIPTEYQQSYDDFTLLFAAFVNDMQDIIDLVDSVELVLGSEDLRRYLLIFQNHHEIRATGGFMGSFAQIDVQKGGITSLDVPAGGTYDLQGQLDVSVEPPVPLQLLNDRWEFQDANWFPDFPASAEKISWFYEHGRGATMDGVIAINASVLERILGVVGPLLNEEHEVVLTQDEALKTLQGEVESDDARAAGTPKAVIGDVMDQLMAQLQSLEGVDLLRLLGEVHAALQAREIQIAVTDTKGQEAIHAFGWDGAILETSPTQDYLMVVNTNIQGQKSDARIEQEIEHQSVVAEDGSVTNTVIIRRTHTGSPDEEFYGAPNMSYVRLYVPEGATLLGAGGFVFPPETAFRVPEPWYEMDEDLARIEGEATYDPETGTRITSEFGKTVFGHWSAVAPGETVEMHVQYQLPFSVFDTSAGQESSTLEEWGLALFEGARETSRYSLVAQRQSGVTSDFSTQIIYPEGWSPSWKSDESIVFAQNGAQLETVLETDHVLGIVMEHTAARE